MKYTIKIDDQLFAVEVGDLQSNPVKVMVDGELFEVWKDDDHSTAVDSPLSLQAAPPAKTTMPAPPSGANANNRILYAPIPGSIVEVKIQPGMATTVGQELFVLEAMKMKNVLRATQSGRVAEVHVSAGQQVSHHQPLLTYE